MWFSSVSISCVSDLLLPLVHSLYPWFFRSLAVAWFWFEVCLSLAVESCLFGHQIGVWFARSASCLDPETIRSGQSATILPSCAIEPQASLNSPGSDTLGDFLGPFSWHMPYFRCLLFSQSFRWCSCLEQSKRTLSQNLTLFCGNFFVCDRDESKISSVGEASCDLAEEFWKHSVREKNISRLFCVESVLCKINKLSERTDLNIKLCKQIMDF